MRSGLLSCIRIVVVFVVVQDRTALPLNTCSDIPSDILFLAYIRKKKLNFLFSNPGLI